MHKPTDWCNNLVSPQRKMEKALGQASIWQILTKEICRQTCVKYFSHFRHKQWLQLRNLTTFHTHRELKRFTRLHFRVNSATEMFSEEIRKVEAQEPNAVGIYPNVRRDARETRRGTQACIEDH